MQPGGYKELLVFDIPDLLVRPPRQIRHELAETPVGIPPA
jgi:hypothetical protein